MAKSSKYWQFKKRRKKYKKRKVSWAWRVYWIRKGEVLARSEQFQTRKDAMMFNDRYIWKGKIKKERQTRWQKHEEKVMREFGVRKQPQRFRLETAIPG